MKTTRSFATIASVVCALTASLPACDGETVTVAPGPTEDVGFQPGETWTGYIESFKFASGSELVTIKFTTPTEGTVSFGVPPTGPQVVNPEVGFPALDANLAGDFSVSSTLAPSAEQFAFTMRDARRDRDRMRFTLKLGEIWRTWCAAQTTTYAVRDAATSAVAYNCVPVDVFRPPLRFVARVSAAVTPGQCTLHGANAPDADGDGIPDLSFECAKMNLCGVLQVCSCNATRCDLSPEWAEASGPPVDARYDYAALAFDIHIDGDKADGATGLGRGFFRRQ